MFVAEKTGFNGKTIMINCAFLYVDNIYSREVFCENFKMQIYF